MKSIGKQQRIAIDSVYKEAGTDPQSTVLSKDNNFDCATGEDGDYALAGMEKWTGVLTGYCQKLVANVWIRNGPAQWGKRSTPEN